MNYLFYLFVLIAVLAPAKFVLSFWLHAKQLGWNYTTEDSRGMYTDVTKTLITASGIAVALMASISTRAADSIAKSSSRVGVVSLILCICASLATMLALTRGHEKARSRNIEAKQSPDEGQLTDGELLAILVFGGTALASFLVGMLFLGRVTFHT
jgi:hypothetical protein